MSQALLDLELSNLFLDHKLGDFPPRIPRPLLLQLTILHDFGISTICKSSLLVLKQVFAKQQILHQKVIDLADSHLRNIFNDTSAKTYYFLCFLSKPRKNWIYQQIPRSLINSAISFITNLLSRVISMTYSSNVPRYQILVPFEKSTTVIASTSQILGFHSLQFHTQNKNVILAIIETLGKKLENIQRSQDYMQNLVNTQDTISPIQQLQQITKESPGSDSLGNKNFLTENHSYISQLQDKANKLERKYQKVKQKLNEQHEAYYTKLEYNNIEKILELVLPVNFPDLF
ncbi:hypothetical protein OXYTRIMIC_622 [Oxytricha trifallax]|uniref:Uncharacterized protein n=1 Tax=Oxytricha trifallax TaxID=1172189 RepID=A0A073I0J3_9SPIT|nr:hypothetical protein OXYTRIMIC_622 [Oxytricha trifallax]